MIDRWYLLMFATKNRQKLHPYDHIVEQRHRWSLRQMFSPRNDSWSSGLLKFDKISRGAEMYQLINDQFQIKQTGWPDRWCNERLFVLISDTKLKKWKISKRKLHCRSVHTIICFIQLFFWLCYSAQKCWLASLTPLNFSNTGSKNWMVWTDVYTLGSYGWDRSQILWIQSQTLYMLTAIDL